MKKQIWKFQMPNMDDNIIEMPIGAEILTNQMQGYVPCIWALVDVNAKKVFRHFKIFGTGNPIPEIENAELKHIGTFQMAGGVLVFHTFEVILI